MSQPESLDIVIPMAGRGSRFANAGFKLPKPLIDVGGKPMIARVIDNLRPQFPHRFIFLVLAEHLAQFGLEQKLKSLAGPATECVPVPGVTEGAACTVLLAESKLSASRDMIIANSDQIVDISIDDYVKASRAPGVDGTIMCFEDDHPKWSFCRVDAKGEVQEVREKIPISNLATVGLYYFRRGSDFVSSAKQMIAKDIRTNGEFYVAPVYNEMIARKQRIRTWMIDKADMHGVGTPEDLAIYLEQSK